MSKYFRTVVYVFAISFAIMFAVIFSGCSGKSKTENETSKATNGSAVSTTSESTTQTDKKEESDMNIYSKAYNDGDRIPVKYAAKGVVGGQNVSIPLQWANIPENSKSLAISMIDLSANNWVHWMVVDIPVSADEIPEGASMTEMPPGSIELTNTSKARGYEGPQPPPGSGDHVYVTTIYALNTDKIKMPDKPTADEFIRALDGHVISRASIKGIFSR